MKQQIRGIGNEEFKFSNQNIKRSYIIVHTIGNAVNVAPSQKDIDLSKLRISLTLEQYGKSLSSSFNAIAPAIKGAMDDKSGSVADLGFFTNGLTCSGINIVPEDVAVKQESYLVIPLVQTPIIVKGDDCFKVSIDILSGFFGTTVDADSKVYIVTEDGTDLNQLDMELPFYYPMTTDKQYINYSFQGVSEISLIDSGSSASKSDLAFTSIDIQSAHYNERFDQVDLFALNQMDQLGTPSERLLNFPVTRVNPSSLVDVKLSVSVDTTLVTTNNQFLHVQQTIANHGVSARSLSINTKVLRRKAMRRGLIKI